MSVVIKICGITNTTDALYAVDVGCDIVGLNFVDSTPRVISSDIARKIAGVVRNKVQLAGVFLDASEAFTQSVLDVVNLDILQFHGNEPASFCEGFGRPFIKVFRVAGGFNYVNEADSYKTAWMHLLDTKSETAPGGTGITFDWTVWPSSAQMPLMLAGGLNPANVATAIAATNPSGVDVASGVETRDKRRKDPELISRFVQEVRRVSS